MKCLLIENKIAKSKKIAKIICIIATIIIALAVIVIIAIKTNNLDKLIDSLDTILALIALIVTIIMNNNEKKKNILISQRIREQEQFEQEIDNILAFYPRIVEDFITNTNLDIINYPPNPTLQNPVVFSVQSLDKINVLVAKYTCEIITINNKLDYLYKFHAQEHPHFDKFKIKLFDMNQVLSNEISNFSNLVQESINSNDGFSNVEAKSKVEKRTIYLSSIVNTYRNNIQELYVLANNCIMERNDLSLK